MEYVRIAGAKIAYVRQGNGTPLVLIHGYPLDHSIWDDVGRLLHQEFDLIMPDLRGFGDSDVMEADNSIVGHASDIAGLLTQLKVKRALLAGHSMGGYVALAFAREFSERLLGLAMVSSQVQADTVERKDGRYATAQQVLNDGVGAVTEAMTPKLSEDPRIQDFVRNVISRQRPLGVASALRAMGDRPDSTEVLAALRCPAVIVHGDADALIPVERGREMKTALPSAHYVELPGLGHMTMMENPQAVADALRLLVNSRGKTVKILGN